MSFIPPLSSCVLGGIFFYVYVLFLKYDWEQPFTKLMCFATCFVLVYRFRPTKATTQSSSFRTSLFEILVALTVISWTVGEFAPRYLRDFGDPLPFDTSFTTQDAVTMFFKTGENPYRSTNLSPLEELPPKHRGYHYGPGTLLAYASTAFMPNSGIRISNLVYLFVCWITLLLLLNCLEQDSEADSFCRLSSATYLTAMFLLPESMWRELFRHGVNDVFPIMLMLLGLLMVSVKRWLLAGIFIGFSFAAKFAPAAFLIVLLTRKTTSPKFFLGCCIGAIPLAIFLLWDFFPAIQNIFVVRFSLKPDSTSLHSITPPELHFVFPLAQLTLVLFFFFKNFSREIVLEELLRQLALVLIVIAVCFKQVHLNHLIWLYPLFALLVTRNRHFVYQTKF